jgi:hypothetical protein
MKRCIRNIQDLVGEEISAIAFVRDYVEIHCDGPIVRCLSNPSITFHGTTFRFPEPGSRDALCQAIGSTIGAVTLNETSALELVTTDDWRITIRLDLNSRRGPEAMHFVPEVDMPIQVW